MKDPSNKLDSLEVNCSVELNQFMFIVHLRWEVGKEFRSNRSLPWVQGIHMGPKWPQKDKFKTFGAAPSEIQVPGTLS